MNFMIYDDPQSYAISKLENKTRRNVLKALKNSVVKSIDDQQEFVEAGHPVYLSFYDRTGYRWRCDRIDKEVYRRWAEVLYRYPQLKIMGCYANAKLNTVAISYFVEDVIYYATLFCNDDGLKLGASDLMLHVIRETASLCPQAKYIFLGPPGNRKGLDAFKLRRQCQILSEPALFRLNPLALLITKCFGSDNYRRLKGELIYHEECRESSRSKCRTGRPYPISRLFKRHGNDYRVYGSK